MWEILINFEVNIVKKIKYFKVVCERKAFFYSYGTNIPDALLKNILSKK